MALVFLLAHFRYTDKGRHNTVRNKDTCMPGLSLEQQEFVAYRLSGMSVEQAAKQLNITPRTGYRWMNLKTVQDAMAGIEHHVQEEVIGTAAEIIASKYRAALPAACDTVVSIAEDVLAPPAARLKAAQMIQERLAPAALEQQQAEQPSLIPPDLLAFVNEEELGLIESIVERARVRKQEAEENNITQMRRGA
jgi:hypothetical protein